MTWSSNYILHHVVTQCSHRDSVETSYWLRLLKSDKHGRNIYALTTTIGHVVNILSTELKLPTAEYRRPSCTRPRNNASENVEPENLRMNKWWWLWWSFYLQSRIHSKLLSCKLARVPRVPSPAICILLLLLVHVLLYGPYVGLSVCLLVTTVIPV